MSEHLSAPGRSVENATTGSRDEGDGYTVRSYRDADRDRFLSLYETVWGHERSPAWFEWRFERNPYSRGVRMAVVERDGELVGAEPLLPFRMVVDGTGVLAHQPVDWIVHPDHRRRGLFTRMTEHLLESEVGEAAFLFNFPTGALLDGLRKFDWDVVGSLTTYYRVQRPSALLDGSSTSLPASAIVSALSRAGDPLVKGYLGVHDRLVGGTSDRTVERRSTVPTAELVDVYSGAPPDRIHVARDEAFYDWRFDNPRWETTTYLARRDGSAVASLVAATETVDDVRCVCLVDAQPVRHRPGRTAAFDALLGAAVADNADADVMKVAGSVLPSAVLRRWGFRPDDRFPLSPLAEPTTHVVRTLPEGDGTARRVGGHDLTDPDDWSLSLADQDIE